MAAPDMYSRVMQLFGNSEPNTDPNEAENKALSYARGAGGNTGMGDAVADWALKLGQDPNNTYAGASAGDTVRDQSDEATQKYPTANRIGGEQVAGSLATLANMAVPGGGGALALPGRALLSAIPGAAHGAYTARPGEDRTKAAAVGAATGAAFPLAEAAAGKLGIGRSLMNMLRPGSEDVAETAAVGAARPNMRTQAPPEPTPQPGGPMRNAWERAPTIPPDAVPVEHEVAKLAEANRTPTLPPSALAEMPPPTPQRGPMLPPPDDSALPDMMASRGIPKAQNPAEFRGKYEPGVIPDDQLMPNNPRIDRTLREYKNRRNEVLKDEFNNQGITPPELRAPQPQFGPMSRGGELMQAYGNEPALARDMGTMPAEYAKPRPSGFPTEYNPQAARDALQDITPTGPPGAPSASPSGQFNLPGPAGQPMMPELNSIPPAPGAKTLALPPGGNAPLPGYMQELEGMEAPKPPRVPENPDTKIGNEDFKRKFNKEQGIGKKTAPPKRKKPRKDDKDE